MGLDTTFDAWHGSYSSFASWRNIVAAIGWEPTKLDEFTLKTHLKDEDFDWHSVSYRIPEDRIPVQEPPANETVTTDGETYVIEWSKHYDNGVWLGQWDNDPNDVLDVLMVHSDCEGIIPHRFCMPLAHRLADLAPLMSKHKRAYDNTMQFVTGLLKADLNGDDLEFH